MSDLGRQPERTELAWQRTTLSALVCLLATERLVADVSWPVAIVLGGLALACVAPAGVGVVRLRRGLRPDGRHLLGLNLMVLLVGSAGLIFALLG